MKNLSDLIHEQTCKIDSIEETLRTENYYLVALQDLQTVVNLYKIENPSMKFYIWAVNRGYALDFDDDIMNIIQKIKI